MRWRASGAPPPVRSGLTPPSRSPRYPRGARGAGGTRSPLKSADALLHDEFIAPSADASDRLIFVLNQVDTIPVDERAMIRDDLIEVLLADGVVRPKVFEAAADPPFGSRIGIDVLSAHLRSRLDEKRVHLGRGVEEAR